MRLSWRELALPRTLARYCKFDAPVDLIDCIFADRLDLRFSRFTTNSSFSGSHFAELLLDAARIDRTFGLTRIEAAAASMEEVRLEGELAVSHSTFSGHVVISTYTPPDSAGEIIANHARFRGGATITTDAQLVRLKGADFAERSVVQRKTATGGTARQPKIFSLVGARVEPLTLVDLDLRSCRFRGAHGLDGLVLDGCRLPTSPRPLGTRLGGLLSVRVTVADEHLVRDDGRSRGWPLPEAVDGVPPNTDAPSPAHVAALYRALRKGRDAGKDHEAAADFYFGELAMRQLASSKPRTSDGTHAPRRYRWLASLFAVGTCVGVLAQEAWLWVPCVLAFSWAIYAEVRQPAGRDWRLGDYLLLGVYRVYGGFGVRARWPLGWLIALLLSMPLALLAWGFKGKSADDNYLEALAFALSSSTALFRPITRELTAEGELMQAGFRVLGTILVALVILAVRSRIKR